MAKPIVILFPGQGSQYVGMGSEFCDDLSNHQNSFAHNLFNNTNQILNYDLKTIMLDGPIENLTETKNTQPAIVLYSLALWSKIKTILDAQNITPLAILGHSVGEYCALSAAGSVSAEDAIKAVHFRGKYMQEAVPSGVGTMYAILKVPKDYILKACREVSTLEEIVSAANFNEPNQTVISGHKNACENAVKKLEEIYDQPFRAIELKVSAPFHCNLMKPAALKMKNFLNELDIQSNKLPYIANINAELYSKDTNPELIKENLINQINGSVLWTQSIEKILKNHQDAIFLEVGPGKVLSGLMRKINRNSEVINFDKSTNFERLIEVLGEN